jgi:hypothetical protein
VSARKEVKRRQLSEFFDALSTTQPFPGKEAIRENAGQALAGRSLRSGKLKQGPKGGQGLQGPQV